MLNSGTWKLKEQFPSCNSVISRASGAQADLKLEDGDHVDFGSFRIRAISSPGHTAVNTRMHALPAYTDICTHMYAYAMASLPH